MISKMWKNTPTELPLHCYETKEEKAGVCLIKKIDTHAQQTKAGPVLRALELMGFRKKLILELGECD